MTRKTRRGSSLSSFEHISPNKNVPRAKLIRRLTPHHVAGNLTIESTLRLSNFQAGGRASTSYAIGSDGRIGLGVEETARPWTSSSSVNDHEAITFEIANNGGAPDWRMSDAAINAWLDLAVEICQFYEYKKVNYQIKPANISVNQIETWIKTWAKNDEMIITLHQWFSATSCPGPYFMRQLPWLVREMNRRLSGSTPEMFIGEGVSPPTTQNSQLATPLSPPPVILPPLTNFREYQITIAVNSLNIRRGPGTNHPIVRTLLNDRNIYTIVEESTGQGATKWGRLKSGVGWLSLDFVNRR